MYVCLQSDARLVVTIITQDIAATCLFVATKVEECTRRLRDIVIACAQKGQKNDKLKLEEDSKVRPINRVLY